MSSKLSLISIMSLYAAVSSANAQSPSPVLQNIIKGKIPVNFSVSGGDPAPGISNPSSTGGNRSYYIGHPSQLTDGDLSYQHFSSTTPSGTLGIWNNGTGVIQVNAGYALNHSTPVYFVRYHTGEKLDAGLHFTPGPWSLDHLTSNVGNISIPTKSAATGFWASSSTQKNLVNFIDIDIQKQKNSWNQDWLAIGEIEVWGAPVIEYTPFHYPAVSKSLAAVYQGEETALLIPNNHNYSLGVVEKMVSYLDQGYLAYQQIIGDTPAQFNQYNSRLTLAQVSETCGFACGYVGYTGMEVATSGSNGMDSWAQNLSLNPSQQDSWPFYELGRNFFTSKLSSKILGTNYSIGTRDGITTGFAVFMRKKAVDHFGGTLETLHANYHSTTLPFIFNDVRTNHKNHGIGIIQLLGTDAFKQPRGITYGSADFYAAVLNELDLQYGNAFTYNFFKEIQELGTPGNLQQIADNHIIAASRSVNQNMTSWFATNLNWNASTSVANQLAAEFGNQCSPYNSSTAYNTDDCVSYNGQLWKAKWWTQGAAPSNLSWGPWQQI